ncbi:uncharacterized protein LOC113369282 [Ctenocephalides felis]|uniref:uncharacterized protein LOC113369282 n=1 Tax=Ctenocephalides felis TaxID=7515 RepID=UPI000E6E2ACE|nr:uncharacterized protein LOC113369282 [Ctenocephalides felis]
MMKTILLLLAVSSIVLQVSTKPTRSPSDDVEVIDAKNAEIAARFRLLEEDIIGSGNDNDFLTEGHNPGKRSIGMDERCLNLGGDSCSTGDLPGSGIDDDYLNGGSNPGKRSWNFRPTFHRNNPYQYLMGSGLDFNYLTQGPNPGKRTSRRCLNIGDDNCSNGSLPGSGLDDDYLNQGNNPGKRCLNLGGDACANGELVGSGYDDDYLNQGGFNPGK